MSFKVTIDKDDPRVVFLKNAGWYQWYHDDNWISPYLKHGEQIDYAGVSTLIAYNHELKRQETEDE